MRRAPAARMALRTAGDLWLLRLSMTTFPSPMWRGGMR